MTHYIYQIYLDCQKLIRIGYKFNQVGAFPFSARILSNYAILIFKPHSTSFYKLSTFDSGTNTCKIAKVLEFTSDHLTLNGELKFEIAFKGF